MKDRVSPERDKHERPNEEGPLSCVRLYIVQGMENTFYHFGRVIGSWPYISILFCLLFTCLCAIGIHKFSRSDDQTKLWISVDSDFLEIMDWQKKMFPPQTHVQSVIFQAENILKKEVLLEMLQIRNTVVNINASNLTWPDVCAHIPSILPATQSNDCKKKIQEADDDTSGTTKTTELCKGSQIKAVCRELSILEIWGNDATIIHNLTQNDIIRDINNENVSLVSGFQFNFTKYLGHIQRDNNGKIFKAKATMHIWFTRLQTAEQKSTENTAKANSNKWEKLFIESVSNESKYITASSVFLSTSSSFNDIMRKETAADTKYFIIGCFVVLLYITLTLGKFNLVEQRPVLALLGLSCVGLSLAVSIGICSACYVSYGPVNDILPFLMLGLGVDDMFIIVQAWNNLTPEETERSLPERIGCALRHAGVSITITSITNFAAFAIGSTTELPALRSFCLYAAVGVISIYFFQATFFVAWLTIDQRRLEDNRHGLLWCWKIHSWTPSACSQKDLCQSFFAKMYSQFLLQPLSKFLVIISTIVFFLVATWGLSNLQREFDPNLLLPRDSYLSKYQSNHELYFPSSGKSAAVYFGNISYFEQLSKIELLTKQLKKSSYISTVNSWYDGYKKYLQNNNISDQNQTETEFFLQLGKFLNSPFGRKFNTNNFRFKTNITNDENSILILASSIDYIHNIIPTTDLQQRAIKEVQSIIHDIDFDGFVKPFGSSYPLWETNHVIGRELYRNMGLALLLVFLLMLLLIASVTMSLLIVVCVLLTLVDLGALMHWTGLTIDTISCVDLVLAIGLCVDYAAHVGNFFMTTSGTRDERVTKTLVNMGPAVLNGGFTTFLSFIFLCFSDSYIFVVFFKIFLGVCMLGLYHGLVFLPVLLSVVGPPPHPNVKQEDDAASEKKPTPPGSANTTVSNLNGAATVINVNVRIDDQHQQ